jgi:hypothetical protein
MDLLAQHLQQLHQVVGEGVIIIDHQNHKDSPTPASGTGRRLS